MTISEQEAASEAACIRLLESFSLNKSDIMGLYSPIRAEISPVSLLAPLSHQHIRCALPKIEGNHLRYYPHSLTSELIVGTFGIAEPSTGTPVIPTIILIPLLAFDRAGHRLGYGGGYYDRLGDDPLYAGAKRLGFAYDWQEIESLPSEAHDVRLHAVITDKRILRFPQ